MPAPPQCFKCKKHPAVIATREGPVKSYCQVCFLDFAHRTTRDTLFRQCYLPPNVPLYVCVSGGMNSMAMLHLLGVLRQQNALRGGSGKIDFQLRVLFLREDLFLPSSPSSSSSSACCSMDPWSDVEGMIRKAAAETIWEGLHPTPLFAPSEVLVYSMKEVLLADCSAEVADQVTALQEQQQMMAASSSSSSLTDVEEEYLLVRRMALAAAARQALRAHNHLQRTVDQMKEGEVSQQQVPHLLLAENGVLCCVRALNDLCRGQGSSIVNHSSARGVVHGCFVLRPIRSLLPKEVLHYVKRCSVPYRTIPTPANQIPRPRRSIQGALLDTVCRLSLSFRATPFNILNSITKMADSQNRAQSCSAASTVDDAASTSSASAASSKFVLGKAAVKNFEMIDNFLATEHDQLVFHDPSWSCSGSREDERDHRPVLMCGLCTALLPDPRLEAQLHPVLQEQLQQIQRPSSSVDARARNFSESETMAQKHSLLCYGCLALQREMIRDDEGQTSQQPLSVAARLGLWEHLTAVRMANDLLRTDESEAGHITRKRLRPMSDAEKREQIEEYLVNV